MSAPLDRAAIQAQIAALQAQLDAKPAEAKPAEATKQAWFVTLDNKRTNLALTDSSIRESDPPQYVDSYEPVGPAILVPWGGGPILVSAYLPLGSACNRSVEVRRGRSLYFTVDNVVVEIVCGNQGGALRVERVTTTSIGEEND